MLGTYKTIVGGLCVASFVAIAVSFAFAETCSEPLRTCFGGLQSTACRSNCDGQCWSTANRCTHIASIPVDGRCGCVAPEPSCQIGHGRAMSKLYRLTVRAHKRCLKRVGAAGTGCPDAEALAAIATARRIAERRARHACGVAASGLPYVVHAADLVGCVRSSGEPLACKRVIARQSLRHAIVVARSQAGCLKETLAASGGFRVCPRGAASDAIVRSLNRFADRIFEACGGADIDTPGSCGLPLCDRVDDGVAYRIDLCAQCCTDQTAFAAVAAAFGDAPPHCGDGLVSQGEACDDGGESARCDADCTNVECGDGLANTTAGEECDDGNDRSGDGCSKACRIESGLHDPLCPNLEESFFYGGVYGACADDIDCPVGACDPVLARCRSAADFDRGWTGTSHDQDWNHGERRRLSLHCALDDEPGCGSCDVVGLQPLPGQCRCANDSRVHCDEAFDADFDDCGGAACHCYAGPPVPFSAGNTPGCVLERYSEQPSGFVDVDSGTREIRMQTRALSFVGETLIAPCPYCDGDLIAADGLRDGICIGGENDGLGCDADARNESFPAPGGAASSLDCFPSAGKNVSGAGMRLTWNQTTDRAVLEPSGEWSCGFPPFASYDNCHCGVCSNDTSLPCTVASDCPVGGLCGPLGSGMPLPNACSPVDGASACASGPDGEGLCEEGPDDFFCDGVLRADGSAFIACLGDLDCEPATIGIDAGRCTLERRRKCFPDRIERAGRADPANPALAAVSCFGIESSAGKNTVHGQPGPAARTWEATSKFYCATAGTVEYVPGEGGCPDP